MIHEINNLIWLKTPKGRAIAKFLIDYGPEADIQWVCFQHDSGEVWTWSNWDVKVLPNLTLGRQ